MCEGIQPLINFTNFGGSVSWIVDTASATQIEAWYSSGYNGIYQWYNDFNGVPRLIAVRIN